MAFPTVASVTITQVGTASTTHNISMPATVAVGDLLLAFFSVDGIPTITTPAGWTAVGSVSLPNSRGKLALYAIDAIGDEDGTTVDFVTDDSKEAVAHVWRITAATWFGTVSGGVEMSSDSGGVASSADPPSHTASWGARQTTWIAACHEDVRQDITGYPASYTSNQNATGSGGSIPAQIASCSRELLVQTENPGIFSFNTTNRWAAITVAVRGDDTSFLSAMVTSESRNFDRDIFDQNVFATDQGNQGGGGGSGGHGGQGGQGGGGSGGGGSSGPPGGGGPPGQARKVALLSSRRRARRGLVRLF